MNKILTLLVLALACAGCANNSKKNPIELDDYFISTQSESNERIRKLKMDKPSENASDILDANLLIIPKAEPKASNADTSKAEIIEKFNVGVLIVLKSKAPLDGMLVWDVLQSVGLKWGDGDLFHWENVNRTYGGDQFFSVWTSTDPGYFLPETIKDGTMNPADLVFGFSLARNADPEQVFDIMFKAVKYCQKRLGGEILDANLKSFNEVDRKKNLRQLVGEMKSMGVIPGSGKALRTYD